MNLSVLTIQNVEEVRRWRNEDISGYRTPYLLTAEAQRDFYEDVVCNRDSPHRYWAVIDDGFIGMGGITHICWENRIGEISLIIDPQKRNQKLGEKAVELLLDAAFNQMGLKTVFGECYFSNPALPFWRWIVQKYAGFMTPIPNRKFWDGKFWNALYFSIDCGKFKK